MPGERHFKPQIIQSYHHFTQSSYQTLSKFSKMDHLTQDWHMKQLQISLEHFSIWCTFKEIQETIIYASIYCNIWLLIILVNVNLYKWVNDWLTSTEPNSSLSSSTAYHWSQSWTRWIQSTFSPLYKINFNITFPPTPTPAKWTLSFSLFTKHVYSVLQISCSLMLLYKNWGRVTKPNIHSKCLEKLCFWKILSV